MNSVKYYEFAIHIMLGDMYMGDQKIYIDLQNWLRSDEGYCTLIRLGENLILSSDVA